MHCCIAHFHMTHAAYTGKNLEKNKHLTAQLQHNKTSKNLLTGGGNMYWISYIISILLKMGLYYLKFNSPWALLLQPYTFKPYSNRTVGICEDFMHKCMPASALFGTYWQQMMEFSEIYNLLSHLAKTKWKVTCMQHTNYGWNLSWLPCVTNTLFHLNQFCCCLTSQIMYRRRVTPGLKYLIVFLHFLQMTKHPCHWDLSSLD